MTAMHNPPHPGGVLRDTVLRADGGVSVTRLANHLGVSRVTLTRVINCKAPVSAELAIRLAAALRSSAEPWLRMQLAYDLWRAQKKRRASVEPLNLRASTGGRPMAEQAAKRFSVKPSSGNVFVDLGLPDAAELDIKVRLAVEVNRLIKQLCFKQETAADYLRASRPEVAALRNYELDKFSVRRLTSFLLALRQRTKGRHSKQRHHA
jgi:antitoxin HigA-1